MSKSITAAMQTALNRNAVAVATLMEIERTDGTVFRLTNNDADLSFDGNTWDSSVPFTIGAVTHGSQLAVDNTEITLSTKGTVLSLTDFKAGRFQKAKVKIFLVDLQDLTSGDVIMHEGWIGAVSLNEFDHVEITVFGLMKIMDFEIGRVYQPQCDADFGDRRCKLALDPSQAWAAENRYAVGDWVYHYDTSQMTAITITNDDFEDDGLSAEGDPITGWTSSTPNDWFTSLNVSGLSIPTGTWVLGAGQAGDNTGTGRHSQSLHQDISLTAAGASTTDIDLGRISVYFKTIFAQHDTQEDAGRTRLEVLDANGAVIDVKKNNFDDLDLLSTWRAQYIVLPIVAGARTVRIYLDAYRSAGAEIDVWFDRVEAYWWKHSTTDPTDGMIHKVGRTQETTPLNQKNLTNTSFEEDDQVTNSDLEDITGWIKDGSFWSVDGNGSMTDGAWALSGGDDSLAVPSTVYTIYQDVDLVTLWELDTGAIDLVRYFCTLFTEVSWTAAEDAVRFRIEFFDSVPASLGAATTLIDWRTDWSGSTEVAEIQVPFQIPTLARHIRFYIDARSDTVGSDATGVNVDFLRVNVIDGARPTASDREYGAPTVASQNGFPTVAGEYLKDNQLVWLSHAKRFSTSTVTVATDTRNFTATALSGSEELYIGARIRWLSGNNTGQSNLIRIFDSGTQAITLYFESLGAIANGDRFQFEQSCQKRFVADCVTSFNNGINFRGLPYLPGKFS
jgi:hypothetical protein